MKRLILSLALAASALSGCAQLPQFPHLSADSGATGTEQTRPYPPSSSNLGLF